MIMRTWRGAVRPEDLAAYLAHQEQTGITDYRRTSGNVGAFALTRDLEDLVEVVTVSLWVSMDAVRAFAGDDPEVARFYPGDDDLLAEKDLRVTHHEVVAHDLDPVLLQDR